MVDYTSKTSAGFSPWLYILAGGIVLILLYAIFAGGGPNTVDPASITAPAESGAESAPTVNE